MHTECTVRNSFASARWAKLGNPAALITDATGVVQPDAEQRKLDNPMVVPGVLSLLTYKRWGAEIKGLNDFPREQWPDNIPLLYFSYHIMVGLGTLFIAILIIAAWLLVRGKLYGSRIMLWTIMLALPFPFIANTAGWITAEVGRQPWIIYGLMRTSAGVSPKVSAGSAWFTLLGFLGMYTILGILFLFLVYREIEAGPEPRDHSRENEMLFSPGN